MTDDEERFRAIAALYSRHASAEIENDIDATTAQTRQYGMRGINLLMAYYNDPETDFPDAGELPDFRPFVTDDDNPAFAPCFRPDPRAPVARLAALLLGLCLAAGASAFVAATGGGMGWAMGVFGVLAAVFGLGVMAGSE